MATTPAPSATSSTASLPAYNTDVLIAVPDDAKAEKEKENGRSWLYRHAQNTLIGRTLEASLRTSQSTVTSVSCISPWGDNNPVVLPCIRIRDVAMMGLMSVTGGLAGVAHSALGDAIYALPSSYFFATTLTGHFVGGVVNDVCSDWVVKQTVERALDTEVRGVLTTNDVITLEITLKHTLLNHTAQLGFFRPPASPSSPTFPSTSPSLSLKSLQTSLSTLKGIQQTSTASLEAVRAYFDWPKGWFSPYLMASQRTPAIPRAEKPAAIMSYGPFIEADYLFAQHILASSPSLVPFCEASPDVDVPYARMFVGFIGIDPFRGVWTQSRRPEEAKLLVHIANGVPGLVIPVLPGAPYQLWSTLPLLSLLRLPADSPAYPTHIAAVVALLSSIIDWNAFHLPSDAKSTSKEDKEAALTRALELVFEAMRLLRGVEVVKKRVDAERAGVVGLRFGNRSLFAREEGGVWAGMMEKFGGKGAEKKAAK